jgi:hypothetical protein
MTVFPAILTSKTGLDAFFGKHANFALKNDIIVLLSITDVITLYQMLKNRNEGIVSS